MSKSIQKKAYIKPELTQIDLKSEEVFLTSCKLSSGVGGTSGRTNKSCTADIRCSGTQTTS